MERLTLDSSVFIAALREPEDKHQLCKKLLARIAEGKIEAIEPFSVLVEVAAAVKRRTGSEDLARRIKNDLLALDTITFEELVRSRAEDAAEIAASNGLRGMDALVVQTAKENGTSLVSLDLEMLQAVKGKITIKQLHDLVR